MPVGDSADSIQAAVERIYRAESRKVLASLIRLLGSFELAEEAVQEAFVAALEHWPREGFPVRPVAWLISTGRFKAIDALRRRARFDQLLAAEADRLAGEPNDVPVTDPEIEDDQLRLIFTCCHPALSPDAQVALTLREVCGLTTEDVASAYLTSPSTIAQRIVRAKVKIRQSAIPYQVPEAADLPGRLDAVLRVVYLVFNEGYSASAGDSVLRPDLSAEAIRLGRLLWSLSPRPEVAGLLALMLLHESRRAARTGPDGEVVLLERQDRARWDQALIHEGNRFAHLAIAVDQPGVYALQAGISAEHARAADPRHTDWGRIVALYDRLLAESPSPVVALNRAVAVSFRDGAEAGIALVEAILAAGDLADYHLAHAAHADLLRRTGRLTAAADAYRRALMVARQDPERRFLAARLADVECPPPTPAPALDTQ